MAIKTKLITIFLIIAAVPMLLVGVINFFYSQQTITTDTLKSMEQLSTGIIELVDTAIEKNNKRFTQLASDKSIHSAVLQPNETNNKLLQQIVASFADMNAMILIDSNGHPIAASNGLQNLPNQLESFAIQAEEIIKLDIAKLSAEEWAVITAGPIKKEGKALGVMVIISDARPFTRITTDFVGFGDSGDIFITSTDENENVRFLSPRRFEEDPDALHILPKNLVEQKNFRLFSGKDKSYSSVADYRNKLVLGVSKPIQETGWNVILKIDRDEALAQLKQIKSTLLYLMAATMLLVLLLALYFSKSITKPIKILSEAVKKVDKGDYNVQLTPTTKDEMRELTLSFNTMIKSIKEQEKEKYDFITSASHQLRTPTSALNWQLGMLQEIANKQAADPQLAERGGKEFKDLVKDIKQNNDGTVVVINDLLKVLELGNGYTATDLKEIAFQELIQVIIDSYAKKASDKQITIKQDIAKGTTIIGNEVWIKEVFINLIDNAITYSNNNGEIRISAETTKEGTRIQIADDGIGVPAKEHVHMFDKFFRAENSYLKKSVGSGLGLVIVKTIVDGHGGNISFATDEDQGMVFTIIIPVQVSSE